MSKKRAYWGDLRLWYAGVHYVESTPRGSTIVVPGIDRTESLHVHRNPNFGGGVEVHTVFLPSALTQEDHRARAGAMLTALEERAGLPQPGASLVWVADDSLTTTVAAFNAGTVTAPGHGFIDGDVVLVRRWGAYSVGVVSDVAANTFTFTPAVAWTPAAHTVEAGDDILLAERVWAGQGYQNMAPLPLDPATGGDYYAADTVYTFSGSRLNAYTRTPVDLDEDLG